MGKTDFNEFWLPPEHPVCNTEKERIMAKTPFKNASKPALFIKLNILNNTYKKKKFPNQTKYICSI